MPGESHLRNRDLARTLAEPDVGRNVIARDNLIRCASSHYN